MLGERVVAHYEGEILFRLAGRQGEGALQSVADRVHGRSGIRPGDWDWLLGRGYWWFGYDSAVVSRLGASGAAAGRCPGGGARNEGPPEVVADREATVGATERYRLTIDTAVAKLIHPDQESSLTRSRPK